MGPEHSLPLVRARKLFAVPSFRNANCVGTPISQMSTWVPPVRKRVKRGGSPVSQNVYLGTPSTHKLLLAPPNPHNFLTAVPPFRNSPYILGFLEFRRRSAF